MPEQPESTPAEPYTVHDDAAAASPPPPEPDPSPDPVAARPRRGPDPVALVAGLAAVAVAVLALTDTLFAVDGRWVVAGGAILVGVIVLAAASRPRTRQGR